MRGIVTLVCLLVSSSSVLAEPTRVPKSLVRARQANYFIISIGINKYQSDFWPDLNWAVADADAISKKIGIDTIYKRHVALLTNAKANRTSIIKAIRRVGQLARSQDVVLIYFSAHGSLLASERGQYEPVVVLSDSNPADLRHTGLPQEDLMAMLEPVRAHRKLVIYATCHSGLGKSRLPPTIQEAIRGSKGQVADLSRVSEGTIVLAASTKGETAREDRGLGGDIYTHFLLQALAIYDRNRDGQVSALEAHDYAKERTFSFTKGLQRPTAKAELIGAGDIPLVGKRIQNGLPILEGYDDAYAGYEVRVNNGEKGKLPLAFPLAPGTSEVEVFSENAKQPLAKFAVSAERGETVAFEELFQSPPFGVGGFLTVKSFSDRRFKKVYGANTDTSPGLRLGAEWRRIQAGLFYVLPTKSEATIWRGLESTVMQTYFGTTIGYRYEWFPNFGLGGKLILGQDQSKLTFRDTNTGTRISETDQPFFFGLGAQSQYTINSSVGVQFDLEYHWIDYQFGRFGTVSGNRMVSTFGASYFFGSKARRIK